MVTNYLRQDLSFFDRPDNTIGALTSRVDLTAQSLFELMGFNLAMILLSIVIVISCAVLSIVTSWKLGLLGTFAGITPMVVSGYIRYRAETKLNAEIDAKLLKSASVASESITAIRTVSSLAIEENVLQRYTHELDEAITQSKVPLMTMMVFSAFTQSVDFFVLALGFW
jgi:ATP-binding cassette subfamily B (MDR/TAP) protein 1